MPTFVADQPSGCIDRALNALRITIVGGATTGPNFQNPLSLTGTVNGVNATFDFPSAPANNYLITVGGVILTPGVDYVVAGLVVTFANPPVLTPVYYT